MSKKIDLIQKYGYRQLEKPEIRVWCHPRKVGKRGDDYYKIFSYEIVSPDSIAKSLATARRFISRHDEAETVPLIAFDGYEFTEGDFWQYYSAKNANRKKGYEN